MTVDRMTRVNALMRRELAEAILRLPAESTFDRSVITVTGVDVARNLRTAVVSVSVRDHEHLGKAVIAHLLHHRQALQRHVNAVLKLKYTPRLVFKLDKALVKGDRVLDLLLHLDLPENEAPQAELE